MIIFLQLRSPFNLIRLQPIMKFALRGRILLLNCAGNQMSLNEFGTIYERRFRQTVASVVAETG